MSPGPSNDIESGRQFAERQREVVGNQLRFREQIGTSLNETTNDQSLPRRLACSISFLSWTHNAALQAAISDSEIDEAVENMKAEWTSVGRWLFALAAMNMALFTIDSQSLFEVDEFAKKAIAISAVAIGLGILCDAWFLVQFLHLRRLDFVTRARGIYGSDLLFCLSAKFPTIAALVSLGSLMAFGGRLACNVLPVLVVMMGLILFALVIGVGYLVNGVAMLGSFISRGALAMGRILLRVWSVEDRDRNGVTVLV